MGYTVFWLYTNLPDAFEKILCIDGDAEFFAYLQKNMQQFPFVTCEHALLSDKVTNEKSLVRTHAGTASAQGSATVLSVSLDELVQERNLLVDVLKIDTDGFDGKVLAGSTHLLTSQKPYVIFEWHPILLRQTNNEIDRPFNVLFERGYQTFIFYTKFGSFSHYMFSMDQQELDKLAAICFNNKHVSDWHYDVIALPDDSLNMVELAECSFAKQKPSAY